MDSCVTGGIYISIITRKSDTFLSNGRTSLVHYKARIAVNQEYEQLIINGQTSVVLKMIGS